MKKPAGAIWWAFLFSVGWTHNAVAIWTEQSSNAANYYIRYHAEQKINK
jgi:hypothetical protein